MPDYVFFLEVTENSSKEDKVEQLQNNKKEKGEFDHQDKKEDGP
jgi:hypothetical protein